MKKLAIYAIAAGFLAVNAMVIPSQAAIKVYVAGPNGIVNGGNWNGSQSIIDGILSREDCEPGDFFRPGQPETPDFPGISDRPEFPDQPQIPNQPDMEQGTQNQGLSRQVFDLVNTERAKAGLSPLAYSDRISQAATIRAKEITGSFSHTRPGGSSFSTVLDEAGVSYREAGENIAYGQKTPEAVMRDWMNSSGHRANILNGSYTTMGVGFYEVNGTGYWVQLFTN